MGLFLIWKIFLNCGFNFFSNYRTVLVVSYAETLPYIVFLKKFVHLICVIKFGGIELCIVFFDCTLISIKSAVILPLSFLIIVK